MRLRRCKGRAPLYVCVVVVLGICLFVGCASFAGGLSEEPALDGAGEQGGAKDDSHVVKVPAPDGQGDVDLPAPGVILPGESGTEQPPPPPGMDLPSGGEEQGTPRGVFLLGVDGELSSGSFTLASRDDVTASAAGCLLTAADATTGGAVVRMILCNASGSIWDIVGIGPVDGDLVVVDSFEYPAGTALGGPGTTSGGLFYLDTRATYSISAPGVSGTMSARLPQSRVIGAEMQMEFDLRSLAGQQLSGTLTIVIDEARSLY